MKLYECSPLLSQGIAPMSEPVTVTYLDLDRLIDTAGLTSLEKRVVDLLMQGYSKRDLVDMSDYTADDITKLFDSAVEKIIERNEYEWHRSNTVRKRMS